AHPALRNVAMAASGMLLAARSMCHSCPAVSVAADRNRWVTMVRSSDSSPGVLARVGRGAAAVWSLTGIRRAMGGQPDGKGGPRIEASPQWRDGRFRNADPATMLPAGSRRQVLRAAMRRDPVRHPSQPIPVVTTVAPVAADGLHLTWYGHAS